MTTATMTKDDVVGLIKSMSDRLDRIETPIQSLLKAAREPASLAGVSPQDYLTGQFKDGMAIFDVGAGPSRRERRGRQRRKSHQIGRGQRADGHADNGFGHWCLAFHDMHNDRLIPDARMACAQVCKSFGTQKWSYQTTGGVDLVTKSDILEASGPTGGYLVPTQFDERLYQLEIETSIIDNYAQQHPMTSRTKIVPALDQVNETYVASPGQSNLLGGVKYFWAAEGATRQQTNPRFRNVVLTANELSFYAGASNTLLQDVAGLDSMMTRLFAEAVSWGVDWSCFRGNGAGQPLGLQNGGCVINVTRQNANQITIQDLENAFQYVYFPTRSEDLICVAHPSCIPWILRLNDQSGYTSGTGRRLFVPIDQGAQADIDESDGPRGFGYIWGYPLLLSEKVPPLGTTGDLGFYNMGAYAQGRRMDVEIMVSPHVQFLQNSSVWRVVVRMDGQPLLGNKITYADGGSYASPVVLLH